MTIERLAPDAATTSDWMHHRRTAVWMGVIGATFASLFVVFWFGSYDVAEYRGDGSMFDTGFWSYPRYHLCFPDIGLNETGEFELHATALPSEKMTVSLGLSGRGNYERLKALNTHVDVEILSDAGSLARASAPLSNWKLAWIPSSSSGKYWHDRLRDIQFRRGDHYTIRIHVTDVDNAVRTLRVAPTLEGGGNELP